MEGHVDREKGEQRPSLSNPLIVCPVNKKSNLFACECSTFKGVGMCPDTVAVAETQNRLFDETTTEKNVTPTATTTGFEREIRTSHHQAFSHVCRTNPMPKQITPDIPSVFPTATEYGHQFKDAAHQSFGMVTGLQQPHRVFPEHHLGSWCGRLQAHLQRENTSVITQQSRTIASNIQSDMNVYEPNAVTFRHPSSLQNVQYEQLNWHAGMSAHPYTLCILPSNVKKCYGCGDDFIDKYRLPPCNIIVKHMD